MRSTRQTISMLSVLYIVQTLICPMRSLGQNVSEHRVIHSEVEGVPLVRTEGGPKHEGPLYNFTTDLILGVDSGNPDWQTFGVLSGFLIASDGRVILCDRRRYEIFIVSPSGELLSRLGGQGSGPREFRELW